MRHLVRYAGAALISAFVVLPAFAGAQATFILTSASTTSVLFQEGPSDGGAVRQQLIQGYRQQSGNLQQAIAALPSVANPSVLMPVLFGVGVKDISPNFGDPRSGGRTHEGEDILAVKGTPIVSPTDAVVLRTEIGASEGNAVYTANPGGETFVYMHLDRFGEGIASGVVLQKGSLIGYVGDTGNAAGGPAHLHLEIHNPAGVPTDPFPRLTGEFTLQEKMAALVVILGETSDKVGLSKLLVTNFRGTFLSALAVNISLPASILDFLASIVATPASASTRGASTLPAGDLDVGSSGALVVALQKYLIQAASGPATAGLAGAGATGNFGAITAAALLEYQKSVGISPATGYYGPATRAFITAHPLSSQAPPVSSPVVGGASATRDLKLGSTGEDVRTLQKLLNANGYVIATSGSGAPGGETTFFGPATQTAVIKFQKAENISPAVGYVGPVTRAALAAF